MCFFFGRLWSLVAYWLGYEIVAHGFIYEHLMHFGALGGFRKRGLAFVEYCLSFYRLNNLKRT